jgi:hypothetical protein
MRRNVGQKQTSARNTRVHRDLKEITMERYFPHSQYHIAIWRFGDFAIADSQLGG